MKFDRNGVMLANVPGSGVSNVAVGQRSGNKRHDTRSGKFGAGGKAKGTTPGNSQVDPVEQNRMLDAVREAARSFPTPQVETIQDFLQGRAAHPEQVDAQQFLSLVRQQQINDLVDIIDAKIGGRTVGRSKARMSAPGTYLRKLIGSLDQAQLAEVFHRLEARGHKPRKIDNYFRPRITEEVHAAARATQPVAAADWLPPEPGDEILLEVNDFEPSDPGWQVEFAERLFKAMPQPVVNVEVPITLPTGKKKVSRDPKTGLITAIEEE